MMKIIGIAMIAISAVLFGYLQYVKIKRRPVELDFFIDFISKYLNELKWQNRSVDEVISEYKHDGFSDYIDETAKLLPKEDFLNAFIEKNEHFNQFHFKFRELAVLRDFFSATGVSGIDAEITLCEKTITALKEIKKDAENENKKLGPLVLKLSVICGILITIILI